MTRQYCDCCGKEIQGWMHKFPVLVHIEGIGENKGWANRYETSDGEPVSGREVIFDLDLRCYNRIMMAGYLKYKNMRDGRDFPDEVYKIMWEKMRAGFKSCICPDKEGELKMMDLIEEACLGGKNGQSDNNGPE